MEQMHFWPNPLFFSFMLKMKALFFYSSEITNIRNLLAMFFFSFKIH